MTGIAIATDKVGVFGTIANNYYKPSRMKNVNVTQISVFIIIYLSVIT